MSFANFKENPWRNADPTYDDTAFFRQNPAPENATGEVILSSLYRIAGFKDCTERDVNEVGRNFLRRTQMPSQQKKYGSKLSMSEWQIVMGEVLESPKQKNQASKRVLQMIPIVPDVALYSGAARLSGNPWNPGKLIQQMIIQGGGDWLAAQKLWNELFPALDVTENDDIWAQWLSQEFIIRRESATVWAQVPILKGDKDGPLPAGEKKEISYPAKQFCHDLHATLMAKNLMTRRQWITLLESVLRLGSVSHVLWLCDVNARLWGCVKGLIEGGSTPSRRELISECITCSGRVYYKYGAPALPAIRDLVSRYLVARIGLNAVLWTLREEKIDVGSLGSIKDTIEFLDQVVQNRTKLVKRGVLNDVQNLQDSEARTLACKRGIGSNILEFCRYTLGQRQTIDATLGGYDQGYFLRKRGDYPSAPYIFSMGPAAILSFVHCGLFTAVGPKSIQVLRRHMDKYGVQLSGDDVSAGEMGHRLRILGLILDSPDAESGMLLVSPFNNLEAGGR